MAFVSEIETLHPELANQTIEGSYTSNVFTSNTGKSFKMDRGVRGLPPAGTGLSGYPGKIQFDSTGKGKVYESSINEVTPSFDPFDSLDDLLIE